MTDETRALATRPDTTSQVWQTIMAIAPVAQASRMFGVTQEQAAIVMLKGHELGIGLAAAFEMIHVIDGKPSIAPKGALALIHQSNELAGMKITDGPDYCECWMKRKNGFEFTTRFTMQDAERAGLVKDKSGWSKYPSNMLRWRAIGYCADVVFPDVIGGMIRPDDLGAEIGVEGEPIKSDFPVEKVEQPPDLAGLLALFSADRVVKVYGGRLPATQEEIEKVVAVLSDEDNKAALAAHPNGS